MIKNFIEKEEEMPVNCITDVISSSSICPQLKDRVQLKKFKDYVLVYDLDPSLNDFIHPSQAVFLSLCTGKYTTQELEYLLSEIYQLSPEESKELVNIYLKKSFPFLDILTEPRSYDSTRYDVRQFIYKSIDEVEDLKHQPLSVPLGINLNLSLQCNFRCRYCYQTVSYHNYEKLDLEVCLKLIREAAEWGVVYAGLTGGEPTLFNGWMVLLEEILYLGMNPVITSNGVIIGSRSDIANHLKEIGLKEITISLDASTPELHHYITRSYNTFSKVISAISYLANSGIRVLVKCVLTRDNMEDIENLIDLVVKLGVSEIGISHCEAGSYGSEANFIAPLSSKEMAIVYEKVMLKREQYSGICNIHPPRDTSCMLDSNSWYPCGGLYCGMVVLPSGKVSICDKLGEETPFIYGDIYKHSLKNIWESDDLQRLRKQAEDPQVIDTDCSKCTKLKFCRTSCFVESMHFKGNYYAKNPCCSGPF